MSLRIKDVAFDDFRSYEHFHLSGIGPLTVLVGPNAVGKTNVVEGIQLLTAQTSFRNPTGVQLVRDGADFARLRATAADENRLLELGLTIEAGKRRFTLNGKQKRTADLKGVIPSVTFTPDDLNLAKGSGTTRRNALDAVGSQLSRNHYLIRRDFDKVLRHKNSLLKDEASPLLLESLNDLMVTCGAQLVCYRAALFGKLAASMASYYAEIVGNRETLSARYAPSWLAEGEWLDAGETLDRDEARERFAAALAASMAQERARHRALVGTPCRPHRVLRRRASGGSVWKPRPAALGGAGVQACGSHAYLRPSGPAAGAAARRCDERARRAASPCAGEVRLGGYPNVYNHGEPGVFR